MSSFERFDSSTFDVNSVLQKGDSGIEFKFEIDESQLWQIQSQDVCKDKISIVHSESSSGGALL